MRALNVGTVFSAKAVRLVIFLCSVNFNYAAYSMWRGWWVTPVRVVQGQDVRSIFVMECRCWGQMLQVATIASISLPMQGQSNISLPHSLHLSIPKCSECMRVCMACVRLTTVAFGRTRLSSIAQIGIGEISSWSSTALHPHFDASTYSFTSLVWSKYASTGLSSLVKKYFTCWNDTSRLDSHTNSVPSFSTVPVWI